jgi:hypothetical protein
MYQLPARPSTQRVYVWRRLKACGAVYLQSSVCVLPDRDDTRGRLGELRQEIEARKGEARLLSIRLAKPVDAEKMKELFRRQSEEQYGEVLGRCRDFHEELKRERAQEHFTFAELEENEEELTKIDAWLRKIHQRNFFASPSREKVAQAMSRCRRDLERYRLQVADAQGVRKRFAPPVPVRRPKKQK